MTFGDAIDKAVMGGQPITRTCWGGAFVVRDGDLLHKMVGNSSTSYAPTTADMLADDWVYAQPQADPAELKLPFAGDAWPGSAPDTATQTDGDTSGTPHTTVVDATVELKAPPGGFISTVNDPHAAENRDTDAS